MIDPIQPDYNCTPAAAGRPTFDYAPTDVAAAPVVTVVTPFWNMARELFHETARSILNQSLARWEWLIVNDAATDPAALEVLETYRRLDPRIRVIDNPVNLGLAGARNAGFEAARAEYVFVCDDDDLLEPTVLEKGWWFLHSHPEFAAVNSWVVGFGEQNYIWQKGFEAGEAILESNGLTSMAMIRRSAHRQVGGYDASIRGGFEDWDFWLRMAHAGLWGATIPEYLCWYRRRKNHGDRWENLSGDERVRAFQESARRAYPALFDGGFPKIKPRWPAAYESVRTDVPLENPLVKRKRRLLLLVPWLQMGGADKFNLDLVEQLVQHGYEATVIATKEGDNSWLPQFTRHTTDVFSLHDFLPPVEHPPFLRYLIDSRRPDVVMLTNSELGYQLLPYLRAFCPDPRYVDYCHMEEEYWKNGGYPRYSVASQPLLDLSIVSSQHLRQWMAARGAQKERIEVVYTNIDPQRWKPDPDMRARVRAQLNIARDEPVILYAARLCEQKKPRVMAQVIHRLAAGGHAFRALVAGNGPELSWLEDYVKTHHLEDVLQLLGPKPVDQMRGLLAAADIFFLPSRWEGIALSVYEAMACELAVVGADVGGQRELVVEDCGFLLAADLPEEAQVARYAEVLQQLLLDSERVRALGKQARERICREFTLDQMRWGMLSLFDRVVSSPSRGLERLPPRLAVESATQAIEHLRLAGLAESLWRQREDLRRENINIWEEAQRLARAWEEQRQMIETQRQLVEKQKQEKEQLWAEAQRLSAETQRLASGWEAQRERLMELDQVKDRLWEELQSYVTRSRELEKELESLRGQSPTERIRRLLSRVGLVRQRGVNAEIDLPGDSGGQ